MSVKICATCDVHAEEVLRMLHAKGIDAVLSDSGVIWLGKDALRILGLVQPSGRPLIDVLPPAEEEDVRAFEDALNAEDDGDAHRESATL